MYLITDLNTEKEFGVEITWVYHPIWDGPIEPFKKDIENFKVEEIQNEKVS